MNLNKILITLVTLLLINFSAIADNHESKKKLVEEVKKINNEINSLDEEIPLTDPFAGQSSSISSNTNLEISEEELQDEMSLYNFKLVGLISGTDHSYITLVNSAGEVQVLTIGQELGKIKLIDLRLTEAIFKKDNDKYLIINFNNQIKETDDY